jgi:hypothetical protein
MGEREQNLIKLLCLPLKGLARALDVSYTAARNYSSGRPVPADVRQRLATFAREHAAELGRLADELEG